jgi:hypothetical protein
VNGVTGEGMAGIPGSVHFDPRLGVYALKSRGVEIEIFDLV